MDNLNLKDVSKGTIVRTIALVLVLIQNVLIKSGIQLFDMNFTYDDIVVIVSNALLIIVAVWNWWKNNSFTSPAQLTDWVLTQLKDNNFTENPDGTICIEPKEVKK